MTMGPPSGAVARVVLAVRVARPAVVGVTWTIALLGAASAGGGAPTRPWPGTAAVLLTATAVHVAVYTWNDVADLRVDRTDPRRARSPLVLGLVRPRTVLTAGCVAALVAVLVAHAAGGARPSAATATALALLAVYDVAGKRSPFPPVLDAVQGLGWGALVLAGAEIAGEPGPATGWVAGYVAVSIVLVNGVLGAGRDVVNDLRRGARTTAGLLGCHEDADGRAVLTRTFRGYGLVLQVLCVAVLVAAVLVGAGPAARVPAATAVAAVGAAATAALVVAVRAAARDRAWSAGLAHILLMLALPLPVLAGHAPTPLAALVLVLLVVPWVADPWVRGRAATMLARPTAGRTAGG